MPRPYENAFKAMDVGQWERENNLQFPNNAGGFSFEVTPQQRLERFLILGTDGGTYYVSEHDLTKQNMEWLVQRISLHGDGGLGVLDTVIEVSTSGRAFRNSPAIFVMALLFKHAPPFLKPTLVLDLPKVCRTATHLFEFCSYVDAMKGWGRSKREAVAGWYTSKTADELAYQAVKYRQRNGWTHRDAMRLSHPKGVDSAVGNFILGKDNEGEGATPVIITAFKSIQSQTDIKYVIENLNVFPELPWEAIPTQFLKEPDVWKKLFYNGQLKGQALVRNVTRMARIGAFNDMLFARAYADRLADEQMISSTRLHPINYLNALVTYTEGQMERRGPGGWGLIINRKRDWITTPVISDALNEGFYTAFKYAEPAGKRTMIALDVSGSMTSAALGIDLSCRQVSAAIAMTVARTEPYYDIKAFDTGFYSFDISPALRLDEVVRRISVGNGGGTDCSLPMIWASNNDVEIDTFLVITDNETWAGRTHPHVALQQYRDKTGIDAKLVVAGVTATEFTIADPRDRGMLDVVGFDANVPKVISNFSAGRI